MRISILFALLLTSPLLAEEPKSATDAGAAKRTERVTQAIDSGLKWLVAQQQADGSWTFSTGPNRGNLDAPNAATAMALLPLLQAGNSPAQGAYKDEVAKAVRFLASRMKVSAKGGDFREQSATMYGHGLASIAVCEAYAQSKELELKPVAQLAVDFIVDAQDPVGGGWRYAPRMPGDTSVLGWQITALHAAKQARLKVPEETLAKSGKFLDSVAVSDGSSFGYTGPAAGGKTTSAIGLLCRLYLGGKIDEPAIAKGIANIAEGGPLVTNSYHDYYATRLMREAGGEPWTKWKSVMARELLDSQDKDAASGSWYSPGETLSSAAGRLGVTSIRLTTLEIATE